ncbi:MAG: hypothetical protein ABIU95_06670 [Burkholderiales bacterium]
MWVVERLIVAAGTCWVDYPFSCAHCGVDLGQLAAEKVRIAAQLGDTEYGANL